MKNLDKYEKEQEDIKSGDSVAIHPKFMKSFYNHCDNENHIPTSNFGTIIDEDPDEGMKYSSAKIRLGRLFNLKMNDGSEIQLYETSLIKLY